MILKIIRKIKFLIKLFNVNFLYYFFLTKKNKIDNWHVYNNLNNRPYKKEIINFCNKKKFDIVLDYGCGFGDIIKKINAKKKFAYDKDPKIKKISDTLFETNGIEFINFNKLDSLKKKVIDCVLFINFLHDYKENEIKKIINSFPYARFILLDGINDNVKGFKYFHKYNFLKKKYELKKKKFTEEKDRTFFVFKKKIKDRSKKKKLKNYFRKNN
jgi:hypothetical protein